MRDRLFRKGLVLFVIILFVEASVAIKSVRDLVLGPLVLGVG